jgi:hypothetical protein
MRSSGKVSRSTSKGGDGPSSGPPPSPRLLHDLLYRIVEEVCWDKDYLYRSFTGHFSALMTQIYERGATAGRGSYEVNGIKSDVEARISWRLQHRLDYFGPNELLISCEIRRTPSGRPVRTEEMVFDLGTGCAVAKGP